MEGAEWSGSEVEPAQLAAQVGQVVGISDWELIDQDRIDRFADLADDHLFIHVDPERAKAAGYPNTIAHGFLILSIMTRFMATARLPAIKGVTHGFNYGSDRLRFLAPVFAGTRVRATFREVALVEKRPGEWLETREVTVEIEGGQTPAMICEWATLWFVPG